MLIAAAPTPETLSSENFHSDQNPPSNPVSMFDELNNFPYSNLYSRFDFYPTQQPDPISAFPVSLPSGSETQQNDYFYNNNTDATFFSHMPPLFHTNPFVNVEPDSLTFFSVPNNNPGRNNQYVDLIPPHNDPRSYADVYVQMSDSSHDTSQMPSLNVIGTPPSLLDLSHFRGYSDPRLSFFQSANLDHNGGLQLQTESQNGFLPDDRRSPFR
jgi:hypothetical protein